MMHPDVKLRVISKQVLSGVRMLTIDGRQRILSQISAAVLKKMEEQNGKFNIMKDKVQCIPLHFLWFLGVFLHVTAAVIFLQH
jgi:hypothetical protein